MSKNGLEVFKEKTKAIGTPTIWQPVPRGNIVKSNGYIKDISIKDGTITWNKVGSPSSDRIKSKIPYFIKYLIYIYTDSHKPTFSSVSVGCSDKDFKSNLKSDLEQLTSAFQSLLISSDAESQNRKTRNIFGKAKTSGSSKYIENIIAHCKDLITMPCTSSRINYLCTSFKSAINYGRLHKSSVLADSWVISVMKNTMQNLNLLSENM